MSSQELRDAVDTAMGKAREAFASEYARHRRTAG
jgi:hypothetical protein